MILLLLVPVFPSFVWGGEEETLRQKLATLRQQRENAEKKYYEKKYRAIEAKQGARDDLARLQEEISRLMTQRGHLKEDIMARRRDVAKLKEKNDLNRTRRGELFTVYQEMADKMRTLIRRSLPLTDASDLIYLQQLTRAIEKRQNPVATGAALLQLMKRISRLTESASLKRGEIITAENEPVKGMKLRLGTVFYGTVTDSGKGAILLKSSGIGTRPYRWIQDPAGAGTLIRDFVTVLSGSEKGNDEFYPLPMDVMQSSAVSKKVTAGAGWLAGFFEWFSSGGVVMYVILLVLAAVALISLERSRTLRREYRKEDLSSVELPAPGDDAEGAKGGYRRLALQIRHAASVGREEALMAMQEVMVREVGRIEKNLALLKSLASLAPLLGLLGTVTGMISLFDVITAFGTGDPKLLAGGISEALVTTEFGLIVAIPAVLAHRLLQNRADETIASMEEAGLALLNRSCRGGEK